MFLRVILLEARLHALVKGVVSLTETIGKDFRSMRTEIAELKAEVEKLKAERIVTVTVFGEPQRAEKTCGVLESSLQCQYALNRASGAPS